MGGFEDLEETEEDSEAEEEDDDEEWLPPSKSDSDENLSDFIDSDIESNEESNTSQDNSGRDSKLLQTLVSTIDLYKNQLQSLLIKKNNEKEITSRTLYLSIIETLQKITTSKNTSTIQLIQDKLTQLYEQSFHSHRELPSISEITITNEQEINLTL